ncbi:unnamed protein product [Cuscuta epithymum]|uniref:Uncharacterized protein n=1 Tax=Cuscuta epithymum TaxID=186058 RepID=A0AAV0G175_9ASTE|nr:unnamed protein product [Cuscuta epithymum]
MWLRGHKWRTRNGAGGYAVGNGYVDCRKNLIDEHSGLCEEHHPSSIANHAGEEDFDSEVEKSCTENDVFDWLHETSSSDEDFQPETTIEDDLMKGFWIDSKRSLMLMIWLKELSNSSRKLSW